jgi:tripeptidyl-peptidase-1
MHRYLLLLLFFSLLSPSAKASPNSQIFEEIRHIPEGWEQLSTPNPQQLVRLRIALRPQNVEKFEQTLLNISSPDNVLYGQHMSREEVSTMLRAADESRITVWSWLMAAGVPSQNISDHHRDWLQVTTQVQMAEMMLNNTFLWYREISSGHQRLRALQYSVPAEIAPHINVIQPTTRFGQMSRQRMKDSIFCLPKGNILDLSQHSQDAGLNKTYCNGTVTPKCLKQMYNVHYQAEANIANRIGFASFLNESARYSDLAIFEEKLAPAALGQNVSVVAIQDAINDQGPGGSTEANLDLQYIVGMAAGVPVTEFLVSGLA